MKTLTSYDIAVLNEPFINKYDGRVYIAVESIAECVNCVFNLTNHECDKAPGCSTETIDMVFKEYNN